MIVDLSSYALKMTLEYLKIVSLQYWSKGLWKKNPASLMGKQFKLRMQISDLYFSP